MKKIFATMFLAAFALTATYAQAPTDKKDTHKTEEKHKKAPKKKEPKPEEKK